MPSPPSSSLQVWLKADAGAYHDAGVTLATNGQTVEQWNDQSGNGNNFSQATSGYRPTFNAGVFGSLPAISFMAAQEIASTYAPTLNDFTVFVVFQKTGAITNAYERVLDKSYNNGFWIGRNNEVANSFGGGIEETSGLLGKFMYLPDGLICDITMQRSGTSKYLWSGLGTLAVNPITVSGFQCGAQVFTVGGVANANQFRGNICEILIYNSALNSTELGAVWSYLSRWPVPNPYADSWTGVGMVGGASGSTTINDYLQVYRSPDGVNSTQIGPVYTPTSPNVVRDPDLYYAGGTTYWISHTTVASYTAAVSSFAIAESTDGCNTWTAITNVDCSAVTGTGSGARAWGATWFTDPQTGNVHILVALSSTGDPGNFQIYEVHPTNSGFTTWSTPVQVTGTGFPTAMIDGKVVYQNGVYYLWYKVETSSNSTEFIQVASSTSLLSGYTQLLTGNWSGVFGSGVEAPFPTQKPDGTWRLYYEPDGDFPLLYSDSGVSLATQWSTATWSTGVAVSNADATNIAHGSWYRQTATYMINAYRMDGLSGIFFSDPLGG